MKNTYLTILTLIISIGSMNISMAHVNLNAPTGGETYYPGDTVDVIWQIAIQHTLLNWDLRYSIDNGNNWVIIQLDIPPTGQTVGTIDTFHWVVPIIPTTVAKIWIYMDNAAMDYQDISNAFTIVDTLSVNLVSTVNASCNAGCNAEAIVASVGGIPPFTYLWNDPNTQTNATATGLCAGNYDVTITDSDSHDAYLSIAITEPQPLIASLDSTPSTGANCDGTATVNPTGGTSPYSYQWDAAAGSQVTQIANNLCGGSYCVTVTDSSGCVFTDCISVSVGINQLSGYSISVTISPNPFTISTTLRVEGLTGTASMQLYDQLGRQVRSQAITQQETTLHREGLPAGIYFYRLQNEQGLQGTGKLVVVD